MSPENGAVPSETSVPTVRDATLCSENPLSEYSEKSEKDSVSENSHAVTPEDTRNEDMRLV
jgi:hypothetical protein